MASLIAEECAKCQSEDQAEAIPTNCPFRCGFCGRVARGAVASLCGHMSCWACVYWWLQAHGQSAPCPDCGAQIHSDEMIPLYGRELEEEELDEASNEGEEKWREIPHRPAGIRLEGMHEGGGPSRGERTFGEHVLRLLGISARGANRRPNEVETPEEQQQEFLSRCLLMLGSFTIMCLLLF